MNNEIDNRMKAFGCTLSALAHIYKDEIDIAKSILKTAIKYLEESELSENSEK